MDQEPMDLNSGLTTKEQALIAKSIALQDKVRKSAKRLSEALTNYNNIRNRHSELEAEYREVQKQVKLMNGQVTKCPSMVTEKKSLTRPSQTKKTNKQLAAMLSDKDKDVLRALILGG